MVRLLMPKRGLFLRILTWRTKNLKTEIDATSAGFDDPGTADEEIFWRTKEAAPSSSGTRP